MDKGYDIRTSVSLYSYQQEYYEGKLDLEGCIREAAGAGSEGIELLAEQMIDTFPEITPEFREKWFSWMEKYHTVPTCYDAFLENHIYCNRTLTLREQINMMERDLRIAHELGFTTLRTLVATPMDVIEGSLKIAENYNVKICLEIHSPFSLNSGWAEGYINMIEKTGSGYFGFMPDWGIFCRKIPEELRKQAFRKGATADGVKTVDEAFANRMEKGFAKISYDLDLGRAHEKYMKENGLPQLMEKLDRVKANDEDRQYAMQSFDYTWNDPKDIADNIKYIYHTHAKCYSLDENCTEPCIPIDEIVDAYKKAGYRGYLSTEYEGNRMLNDALPVDSIEQVRRHQTALKRAIEKT
jgi:sugar phosphate isomerase/epimerase